MLGVFWNRQDLLLMMGTEIFKFDASWAEKMTKTRVSFLMTPTVLLINTRRSPQDGTEAAWAGLWLLPPTFVATICWHKQHWRWCRPLVTRISYTHTTQQHHNNNTTTSRRNKHSIRQDIFVFRPFFESNNRKNIFVVIFNLFHSSCLVESATLTSKNLSLVSGRFILRSFLRRQFMQIEDFDLLYNKLDFVWVIFRYNYMYYVLIKFILI